MGGIREVKFHVVPFIVIFLKTVVEEDIRLDFGRVERHVVEFSVDIGFKPKRLTGNQLPCKIHVVLNYKSSCRDKRSLVININHRFPFDILGRIEH